MKTRNRQAPALPSTCSMLFLAGTMLSGGSEAGEGPVGGSQIENVSRALEGYNYVIQSSGDGAIESVLVSGENGSGKNASLAATAVRTGQTVSNPLAIAVADPSATAPLDVQLSENMQGQAAIDALGDKLPAVAAEVGMSAEKFQNILLRDSTAWIDQGGRLLYVEKPPAVPEKGASGATATAPLAAATTAPLDLTQTFKLHSRPGSHRVIYLDFNGQTVTGTAWNTSYNKPTIVAPAFNTSGTADTFDSTEQQAIQYVWQRVAEDYAPFDVDVTTEEPPAASILRTDLADLDYGTRVLITTNVLNCTCGGIAYLGIFDTVGSRYQPAWVFFDKMFGQAKNIAEAVSHESGHNLGLSHDGTASATYYQGHGSGATSWAPIMGAGYSRSVTQWSEGEYPGANNKEDDFAIIQSNGAAVRPDDAGNTLATAKPLGGAAGAGGFVVNQTGLIERQSDLDVYFFSTAGGSVSLNIVPAELGPNLDIAASLFNAAGQAVASSNPVDRLDASFALNLPAGSYYLRIDGTGKAATSTDPGYSDYGSLGQYRITGQFPTGTAQAPIAAVATAPATGTAPLPVSFQSTASVSTGPILGYAWSFGDGTAVSQEPNPLHTYTTPGSYDASLTITDSAGLKSEKSVTIVVTPDPNLNAPRVDNIALSIRNYRRFSEATAAITVRNANGKPASNVRVRGKWSGLSAGEATGTTTGWGLMRLTSPNFTTRSGTLTFTVTSISVSGETYTLAPGANNAASISQ